MPEYQVTCVRKPNRFGTHEHITHIGNIEAGWQMTREEAIARIDSQAAAFFTIDRQTGRRAYLRVVRGYGRLPFLQTEADGKWNDNLLALAECGPACRLVG